MDQGFFDEDEDFWDMISFNAIEFFQLPVLVTGDGIKNKLDVKDIKGADGTAVKNRGSSARKFKVKLEMFRAEHRRAWLALQPLIGARYAKTLAQPVIITYPSLAIAGIASAWIDSATLIEPDGKGSAAVTLDCLEDLVPKAQGKKKAKAKTNSFKGSSLIDDTRGLSGGIITDSNGKPVVDKNGNVQYKPAQLTGKQIDLNNVPASVFNDDLIPPFVPDIKP